MHFVSRGAYRPRHLSNVWINMVQGCRQNKCTDEITHNDNRSINGLVRHVANSKAQAHVDVMWLEFAIEPLNARLGLATNGLTT